MKVRQAGVLAGALGRMRAAQTVLLALAALGWPIGPSAAAEKHQSPLTTILNTKIHPDPGPVPEFVEKSRASGGSDYIPLHAAGPARKTRPKTAAELKAMEMDLNAAAAANRARAGQRGPGAANESSKLSTATSGPAAPIH